VQGNLFTYMFGPQVKFRTQEFQLFAHVLFGAAHSNVYANLTTAFRAMAEKKVRFGQFELDFGRFQLFRLGEPARLEGLPLQPLMYLIDHYRQLVTREQIADALWGRDIFVDVEQGSNTAIRKVRMALETIRHSREGNSYVDHRGRLHAGMSGDRGRYLAGRTPRASSAGSSGDRARTAGSDCCEQWAGVSRPGTGSLERGTWGAAGVHSAGQAGTECLH
jgi:hypothetical protein